MSSSQAFGQRFDFLGGCLLEMREKFVPSNECPRQCFVNVFVRESQDDLCIV